MEKQKAHNNITVKRINRNRVFCYIIRHGKTSRPEIAEALGMSVPTVMQMVTELRQMGIVQEVGELESTGGRKAKAIAPVWNARYSVGIDITRNHVGILLTDLSRQVLFHERIYKPFLYQEEYFQDLGKIYQEFIQKSKAAPEKVLGVGISIPGIVDSEENRVLYSHVLQAPELDGRLFQRYIPLPCTLVNDANAAGSTEERKEEDTRGLVYLSLSNSVGGAIAFSGQEKTAGGGSPRRRLYVGQNWRSGEFGHMILRPGGERCYCGKRGCMDVYCSALRLAPADGSLKEFFSRLAEGDPQSLATWETYLENLALAVENLHMAFDCDVVLGGYVGGFMEPYIEDFRGKIARQNIFENSGSYVKLCRYRVEASALGAALHYIDKYIAEL